MNRRRFLKLLAALPFALPFVGRAGEVETSQLPATYYQLEVDGFGPISRATLETDGIDSWWTIPVDVLVVDARL